MGILDSIDKKINPLRQAADAIGAATAAVSPPPSDEAQTARREAIDIGQAARQEAVNRGKGIEVKTVGEPIKTEPLP
jgi:hypothetical protein